MTLEECKSDLLKANDRICYEALPGYTAAYVVELLNELVRDKKELEELRGQK